MKEDFIKKIHELKYLGIKITPEYKFCKTRKFKADFMLEYKEKQILIEYEGLFSVKSRHTGVKGFTNDTIKYNLAQKLGFKVFRYTAINYKMVTGDVTDEFGIE